MVSSARFQLQLSRLPAGVRQRLAQCIAGKTAPRPIWSAHAEPDPSWVFFLAGGLILLGAMAFATGDAWADWPWVGGWAIASTTTMWGIIGWSRGRATPGANTVPQGQYLFATDLIEAENGICSIYDLEQLSDVRVRAHYKGTRAAGSEVQLVFPSEVVSLNMPGAQSAKSASDHLQAARNSLAEAFALQNWDEVAALDPLYEARYGGNWDRFRTVATGAKRKRLWHGLSAGSIAAGIVVGICLAPALWYGSNRLRDAAAFEQAKSANTEKGWRAYLSRSEAIHRNEALTDYLPAAAFEAAKRDGSTAALREFLKNYGSSAAAPAARDALHQVYEAKRQTLPGELDPAARVAFVKLLDWLEANQTNKVDLRFSPSSKAFLGEFDDIIKRLLRLLGLRARAELVIPPIAPSFSDPQIRSREDALFALISNGIRQSVPPDLLRLQKGDLFSGAPVGFSEPAIAIQWVANPKAEPLLDEANGRLYMGLQFHFDVSLAVPGDKPYTVSFDMDPGDYIPDDYDAKLWYDRMVDIAFHELDQRTAATFFPKHLPERGYVLHKAVRRRTVNAADPAQASAVRYTATGFLISENGYLVTAQHFTKAAKRYVVITKSGPVPADLIREDPANDLAILQIHGSAFSFLPVRTSGTIHLGESVSTLGYPQTQTMGLDIKVGEGAISGLNGAHDDPRMFQISVPVQKGNSGGPLLDANGNVVGIITGKLADLDGGDTPQNVNYAIKSNLLLNLIESVGSIGSLPPAATTSPSNHYEMIERARNATVLIEGM